MMSCASTEDYDIQDIATCEFSLTASDNPVLPPIEETGGIRLPIYDDPIIRNILISRNLPAANRQAAADALNSIFKITYGYVNLTPVTALTTCDQPWTIHGAAQGDCHLTYNDGWRVGWYQGSPFKIVVRTSTAEGGIPSPMETYIVVLHEMLHGLGLSHASTGIMHKNLSVQMNNPRIRYAQTKQIMEDHHWPTYGAKAASYPWSGLDPE